MNKTRLLRVAALTVGGVMFAAIVGLVVLVSATSGLPSPRTLPPAVMPRPSANPNVQLEALIANGEVGAARTTSLSYHVANMKAYTPCRADGRWTLDVNPESQVGHPYVAAPTHGDWSRAKEAIQTALSLCPTLISLVWVAHDPRHPLAEVHVAFVPVAKASFLDAASLKSFALMHQKAM